MQMSVKVEEHLKRIYKVENMWNGNTTLTHHATLHHCKNHDRQFGESECPECRIERLSSE